MSGAGLGPSRNVLSMGADLTLADPTVADPNVADPIAADPTGADPTTAGHPANR